MVWENDSKMQEAMAAAELGDYSLLELYTGADLSSAKEDKNFANNLSMALSVYEATGSPKMLESLGIDTSYMDQILRYTLMEAQKSANGSSGGSGGGSYKSSGGSPISNYPSFSGNDTTSYWIKDRLTDKQLKNYNSRKGTNISMASYAGDQLAIALSNNQITKQEYLYLCDYYGIK